MPADAPAPTPAETPDGRPILLLAPTRWEAAPVAKALGLDAAGEGRCEGLFGHRRVTLLSPGIGAKRTADALHGVAPAEFGLALSVGLCGAMQPELKPGDLVVDPHEADLELVHAARETAKALGLPFHFGRVLHTNVVLGPEAKRALGAEHRAVACDMETAALRRWAHGSGLSVLAVRAVLDGVDERLPPAPEGEGAGTLARYALANAASLPLMARTGWRMRGAMKGLARFLAAYLEAVSA